MSTQAAQSTAATTPNTPSTGLAGIGAAAGPWGMAAELGLGVGASLLQASQQAAAARNFEGQKNMAIRQAKELAGANFMKNVSVPVEAYEAAMRQGTAQQMQALQAGTEGDVRNLQGIAGRTNEAATDFDFGQRDKMAQDLYKLHVAQAQEQKESANALAGIGLKEAQGAALAQQQAELAKQQSYGNAALSGLRLVTGLDKMRALYPNQNTNKPADAYSTANDPLLNSIRSNTPAFGPQQDNRGYSSVDERFIGIPQIDWSLFNQ